MAVVIAMMATIAGVAWSTSAFASNDAGHRLPNANVTVNLVSLTGTFDTASSFVVNSRLSPTDLNPTLYWNSSTKTVNVYDANYGLGWYGRWSCTNRVGIYCNTSSVQFDLSSPPGGSYSDTEAKSLACEELGHSVGLDHNYGSYTSCMSGSWLRIDYDYHDVYQHINVWY